MHLLSRCYCICRRLISANICKFTLTVCNPSLARDDDPARPNWQQQAEGTGDVRQKASGMPAALATTVVEWHLMSNGCCCGSFCFCFFCCSGPHATVCDREGNNKVKVMHDGHAIAILSDSQSLSVCLSVCLYVCLPACPFVCLQQNVSYGCA